MKHRSKKHLWTRDVLLEAFALTMTLEGQTIAELYEHTVPCNSEEASRLEILRQRLALNGNDWNEEELKMHFVALLVDIVHLHEPSKVQVFYERELSAVVEDIELSAKTDLLLATPLGVSTLKQPYFCLQEFKKSRATGKEPEGQMLAGMLIAQALNRNGKTVYGAYIIGRNWFFASLEGKQYQVSRQFDASSPEGIRQVFSILRTIKHIILTRLIPQSSDFKPLTALP